MSLSSGKYTSVFRKIVRLLEEQRSFSRIQGSAVRTFHVPERKLISAATMSGTSVDDVEQGKKEIESKEPYLTQEQEDLREAAEPPFVAVDGSGNGAPLAPVVSAKPSINNIKSVPNGGLKAWLQVLGSFFLFWNT